MRSSAAVTDRAVVRTRHAGWRLHKGASLELWQRAIDPPDTRHAGLVGSLQKTTVGPSTVTTPSGAANLVRVGGIARNGHWWRRMKTDHVQA